MSCGSKLVSTEEVLFHAEVGVYVGHQRSKSEILGPKNVNGKWTYACISVLHTLWKENRWKVTSFLSSTWNQKVQAKLIFPMSSNSPHFIYWFKLCDLLGFGNVFEVIEFQGFRLWMLLFSCWKNCFYSSCRIDVPRMEVNHNGFCFLVDVITRGFT